MTRLGVLGGTFDPIHIGHLLLAQFVMERLPLAQVIFVPAADPPHKEAGCVMAPADDRRIMVELAIQGMPGFVASRTELERPGKSYTVDTLRQLRAANPDSELHLIIGADNLTQIAGWHDPWGIFELCTVVAGSRTAVQKGVVDPALARRIQMIETPIIDISSTQIRQRLAVGMWIRYLVPEKVEAHIRRRGLYRTGSSRS